MLNTSYIFVRKNYISYFLIRKNLNFYFFLQKRFLNTYHCCSQESSTNQSSQDFQSHVIYSPQDCQSFPKYSPHDWQSLAKQCPQDCQSPEFTSSKNKYCPARSDSTRKLQDRKTAKEAFTVPGEYKSLRKITVRKTMRPRKLQAQRSSTVRRDCPSLAITDSRTWTVRQELEICPADLLADSRLAHEQIPRVALLRKTALVPGTILVIWQVMLKWSSA